MIVTYQPQLSHWLHQLPTVGKGRWKTPTCGPSFCCKSRRKGKPQPYYWLATDHNTRTTTNRPTEREKQNLKGKDSREKTKNKWAYKKLPTYKTLHKIILKTPKAEIPKREFYLLSDPLVLFRRIFKE
jgi:hypothetical protein